MSDLDERTFSTRQQLDATLAVDVAAALEHAISEKGSAILVVSGGSTPLNFFGELSEKNIPWHKVQVTLADERWVPADHQDSNEKLVREKLLVNKAATASFISLKTPADDAKVGAADLDGVFSELPDFDVVILGMGGDGHTASLFPGAEALAQGLDMNSGKCCIAMQPLTAPHQRISLTLPRLLNASQIIIHITGNDKKEVLEQARADKDPEVLPVSAIITQCQTPVILYWSE